MRRSAVIVVLALGCGRVFRPVEPAMTAGTALNLTVWRVNLDVPPPRLTVSVRTTALGGVRLRGAKLADPSSAACSAAGLDFEHVERDGAIENEGPVDIANSHDLRFFFAGVELPERLKGERALDIETEGPSGRSCVRVMLPQTDDPRWRSTPTGVGLYAGMGARAYPAVSETIDGSKPGVSFEERLGVSFGKSRLWGGIAVDGSGAAPRERFLVLGAGLDGAVLEHGPWSVWLGAGYDLVLDLHDAGTERLPLRRTLHGPRVAPGLSYALVKGDLPIGLYPRPLILRIGLDAPTAIWFGRGDAPTATVVSAATVALTLDM